MSVKRLDILDRFIVVLQRIKAGQPVGGLSTATYTNSVGYVGRGYLDFTNWSDSELPAVMVLPDRISTFTPHMDGMTSDGSMLVALHLVIRDPNQPLVREQQTTDLLETFFRDVDLAIHAETEWIGTSDIAVLLESFESYGTADSQLAEGIALYRVEYEHLSF